MNFLHKPKLGDTIYSLPLIKHLGGGVLYLDPVSTHFEGQAEHWIKQFNWLMPLIKAQPYIEDVKIHNGEPIDMDLDKYMDTTHLTAYDTVNIVDNHFIAQGIKPPPYAPWLTCNREGFEVYTIVANSDNHHDDKVDYTTILKDINFLFVGTFAEITAFKSRTGITDFLYQVPGDALHLAEIINACTHFIGNQSLPLAIALGLGKKCYVEQSPLYPNCIMGNYNRL
jgi:hypothetical protein